jgi:hypothetical protein
MMDAILSSLAFIVVTPAYLPKPRGAGARHSVK